MSRQPLRRVAIRALSFSPSPVSVRSRTVTSITKYLPRHQPSRFPSSLIQRRFASEEAQTQSEPEADGATEAQHGHNSIAASSHEAENPEQEEKVLRDQEEAEIFEPEELERESSALGDPSLGESAPEPPESRVSEGLAKSASSAAEQIADSARSAYEGASQRASSAAQSAGLTEGKRPGAVGQQAGVIYVGNLFFDATEDDLSKEFGKVGEVINAVVKRDARGLSRGFAYITYADRASAQRAIEQFNFKTYEGRRIVVSTPKSEAPKAEAGGHFPPSSTLFVGNMPFDMSDQELNTLFREVKNVTDVRVAIDRRTGQPRGFAHADFIDQESAGKAMEYLNTKDFRGRPLRVNYGVSSGGSSRRQA